MAGIEESWGRVTAWLAANAPASYATLRPPATPAELDASERDLSTALPAELRRLLLINNGAADFIDGVDQPAASFLPSEHRLLSAAELAKHSREVTEALPDPGDDIYDMIGQYWHPKWVLFGRHINADGMAIDQRPGPRQGAVGEFLHMEGTEFNMAPSLSGYVANIADSIENGADFLVGADPARYRPFVENGGLCWEWTR
jgi:cell wall assembly regulator SMI1